MWTRTIGIFGGLLLLLAACSSAPETVPGGPGGAGGPGVGGPGGIGSRNTECSSSGDDRGAGLEYSDVAFFLAQFIQSCLAWGFMGRHLGALW